jgi:hypothetical protein
VSVQTADKYPGCNQRLNGAVDDRIGIDPIQPMSDASGPSQARICQLRA